MPVRFAQTLGMSFMKNTAAPGMPCTLVMKYLTASPSRPSASSAFTCCARSPGGPSPPVVVDHGEVLREERGELGGVGAVRQRRGHQDDGRPCAGPVERDLRTVGGDDQVSGTGRPLSG